jgi:hypothetical protein
MKTDDFWNALEPELNTGCWLWPGAAHDVGYGRVWFDGRVRPVHRVAWALTKGEPPAHLCVCHRCDTPACANPAHLFLGTHKENAEDKVRKGRHRFVALRGADHPTIHTTVEEALAIRAAYAAGLHVPELAAKFQKTRAVIRGVVKRRTWRDL